MTRHDHVRESVARHGWTDLYDWAAAIGELAEMDEREIEAIAAEAAERSGAGAHAAAVREAAG